MPAKRKKTKALLLYSGGLDSILAAKILERQGVEVMALTFVSYFFGAEQAERSAQENNIKLTTRDISKSHLEIVKNPRFGRGAGMNPCVGCHLLMLKEAKKIAAKKEYDIIATGEVLGQRPMSQNIRALKLIEREAGLVGKILRPLSARVLPETEMEISTRAQLLVDMEKLYGITGRSRKEQIALAKKYKIKYFPTPAGGCILTDKEYSKKLRELLENVKNPKPVDFELLRLGRHFWVDKTKIILGRNYAENLALKKLAEKSLSAGEADHIIIEPQDIPGPTALVRGKRNKTVLDFTKKMLLKYTKNSSEDTQVKIIVK